MRNPISLLLLAALAVITLLGYLQIPADLVLPVRWGLHGEVTSTLPRNLALLQMPLAAIAIWVLVSMVGRFGTAERRPSTAVVLRWAIPLLTGLFALVQLLIVLIGLGVAVPFFQIA
jgi:immunity protein, SdpI family